MFQNITLNDYCLSYECTVDYDDYEEYDEENYDENYEYDSGTGGEWSIVLKACLCIDSTELDKLPYPNDLPKCCGKFPNDSSDKNCVKNQTLTDIGLTCPGKVHEYLSFTHQNETHVQASILKENIIINKTDEFSCIGPTWKYASDIAKDLPKDANFSHMFDMKLFHCKRPCDGKAPCFR